MESRNEFPINQAQVDPFEYPPVKACPTTTPEPHQLGEFPLTCYNCHVEADS